MVLRYAWLCPVTLSQPFDGNNCIFDAFSEAGEDPAVSGLHICPPRRLPSASRGKEVGATLSIPRTPHNDACKVAGIEGLTLHGLRRSFKSLTEWLEVPVGVVAQIQGHKPSATAEKHYTVRPLDPLRRHHERIEAWILEQGGVPFVAVEEPGKLRVVNAA